MKKQLLLTISLGMSVFFAQAQIKRAGSGITKDLKTKIDLYNGSAYPLAPEKKAAKATSANKSSAVTDVEKYAIGTSYNLYGVVVPQSTVINVHPDKNWVSFTHRVCSNINAPTGDVYMQISTTGGETWPSNCSFNVASGSTMSGSVNLQKRYPSGVIVNPNNSSDPNDCFAVVAGPVTDGSAWVGNYISSKKLNGSNYNDIIRLNATSAQQQSMPRIDMATTDNGKVHILGTEHDINNTGAVTSYNIVLNTFTFNSTTNTFDWTEKVFGHSFKTDPNDGSTYSYINGNMAWSKDGLTGFVAIVGADASANINSYQPVFYKTTDAGATWNQLGTVNFGSNNYAQLAPYISPTYMGTILPQYFNDYGSALVIDADGNPHYVSAIFPGISNHPDSLGYTSRDFPNDGQPIYFFDTFYKDGNWQIIKVGTLNADNVPSNEDVLFSTGYDCRLQTTVDLSTNKIFYSWLDSDVSAGVLLNFNPDIMLSAIDFDLVNGNSLMGFTDRNITAGGSGNYAQFNYWLYAGDYALHNGSDFCIPMTTSELISGVDGNTPSKHYYVDNVCVTENDFNVLVPLSIPKTAGSTSLKTGVYPNPTNGAVYFNLKTIRNSNVTISIYNIYGQEVISHTSKTTAGENSIKIDTDALSTGVYNYTVSTEQGISTGKIVKE